MFQTASRAVVVLTVAAAFTSHAPAGEAVALLRVKMAPARLVQDGAPNQTEFQVFKETQAKLLTCPFVLRSALRDLQELELAILRDEEDPLVVLQRRLVADYPGKSEVLRVSMKGDNAEELVIIVDAVVNAYLREVAQAERSERVARLTALREAQVANEHEIRRLRKQLGEATGNSDSAMGQFRRELERQQTLMLQQRIDGLRGEQLETEITLAVLETNEDATKKQRKKLTRLRRTVTVLNEKIKEQEDLFQQQMEKMDELAGASSELLAHKAELKNLQQTNQEISREITQLELSLQAPSRVSLIQPAMFVR